MSTAHYARNSAKVNVLYDWKVMRQESREIAEAYLRDLAGTEPTIENLVKKLSDGIQTGRWSSIVGDDIRGRFAALIVGAVAKRYAREHGRPAPSRLFLAAGHDLESRWDAIENYARAISGRLGHRVLFVTEYVETGQTVLGVVKLLQGLGIACDIATTYIQDRYGEDDDQPVYSEHYLTEQIKTALPEWRGVVFAGKPCEGAPLIDRPSHKDQKVMGIVKGAGPVVISYLRDDIEFALEFGADAAGIEEVQVANRIHQQEVINPVRAELQRMSARIYSAALA